MQTIPSFNINFLIENISDGTYITDRRVSLRSGTGLAALYAADLFGGELGMALCSTLLVPVFGILPVAGGIGGMKVIVELVNLITRKR